MGTGRNELCPCGSGKKFKHCCLRTELPAAKTPQQILHRRVRAAIQNLTEDLMRFIGKHLGHEFIDEAWAEFSPGEDAAFDSKSPHMQVFIPWLIHQWSPAADSTRFAELASRAATVSGEFLARRRRNLDPLLVRYLEACKATAFSFHEVIQIEPGRGVHLRDLILERERFVSEHSGSQNARRGDILFAQVVDIDGLSLLDGSGQIVIEPGDKPAIIELRKAMREDTELADTALLRTWDLELIYLYLDFAERRLNPQLPKLQNTDGEALVLHKLVFSIADAQAAAAAFDAAQLGEGESIESDGERRFANDILREAEWTWMRAGNAMHKTWDNTTLARLELKHGQLRVEVNSVERAARARSLVEGLLGANAEFRVSKLESSESLLERARQSPGPAKPNENEELMQLPEVREKLREMLLGHYTAWLDTELPLLGNRTPRQAVGDADGREAVEAVIAQIERDGQKQTPPLDQKITQMLRRELGLPADPLAREGSGA
jgi:SEC-C motif